MKNLLKNNISFYSAIFLVLLAFSLLTYKINKPFYGHHDWNAVFFGNIAKNTAKFGFLKTKFGAVYTFLPNTEKDFEYHTHQPPLLHLLLGLEAKLIGVKEWSMRLIPIGFSLAALLFFFKIAEMLFDRKIAFTASLFFILNPMFIYFGKLVVHEPLGLGLVAYSFYRYLIFFKKPDNKNLFYLGLSQILACFAVWAGYYLAPLNIVHFWLFSRLKSKTLVKRKILWLMVIPFASFFIHLMHIFILTGEFDIGLFKTLLFRMNIGAKSAIYQFTLFQYIKQEVLWTTVYFTRVLSVLNLIYFLLLLKKILRRQLNFKDGFILMLCVFGLIDPIIFRNLLFIHDYKLIYLIFAIVLMAALGLDYLKEKLSYLWKKNKFITAVFFYLIIILFATDRLKFTKTLLETSINKSAYDLGLILQRNSLGNEVILIGSESYAEFQDIFLKFYGKRKLIYFKPSLKDFNKLNLDKARLVVFVKEGEKPNQELLNLLEENYQSFIIKDFLLFDLKTKK